MSDAMGVGKPDRAFFDRTLELIGSPDPGFVAYVGDRVDNDVLPAVAAGMRAVWLRRGPWGLLHACPRARPGAHRRLAGRAGGADRRRVDVARYASSAGTTPE